MRQVVGRNFRGTFFVPGHKGLQLHPQAPQHRNKAQASSEDSRTLRAAYNISGCSQTTGQSLQAPAIQPMRRDGSSKDTSRSRTPGRPLHKIYSERSRLRTRVGRRTNQRLCCRKLVPVIPLLVLCCS